MPRLMVLVPILVPILAPILALALPWLAAAAQADARTATETITQSVEQEQPGSEIPNLSGNSPVGLGAMVNTLSNGPTGQNSETGYAFVVEGENHFKQRLGQFGLKQYGEGESRLELGDGVGVSMAATSGITVVGLKDGKILAPHVGVEPFSGRIVLNSNSSRESYYEYLPMASLGLQFAAGSCRILPLVRAGAGAGNLDKSGLVPALSPAVGVGSYIDCAGTDFSAELTRLDRSGQFVELASADALLSLNHGKLRLGMRGEQDSEPAHTEQRILLLLRSRLSF